VTEEASSAVCPWCGHTDRRGNLCVGCEYPWDLSGWIPHQLAQATAPTKEKLARALLASIATPELESMAVDAVASAKEGKAPRNVPVAISISWILKARALLQ
jgi:hypothetical protein